MKITELNKWDSRFLDLARTVGLWSKGPRTRVGAVIVRHDRSVASMGYNGPPRGFDDEVFLRMTREEQHKVVVHAEVNALQQISQYEAWSMVEGYNFYTMYVSPLYPCVSCAATIASCGIKRVVAYCGQNASQDWLDSAKEAEEVFKRNNIEYIFVTD